MPVSPSAFCYRAYHHFPRSERSGGGRVQTSLITQPLVRHSFGDGGSPSTPIRNFPSSTSSNINTPLSPPDRSESGPCLRIIALLFLIALPCLAQAPKNTPREVYQYLSEFSPFTDNRTVAVAPPSRNPAENLAITGFTKFPEGYFIILTDRTQPDETIIIQPGLSSDVDILEVYDETETVELKIKYQGHTAIIGLDSTLTKGKHKTATTNNPAPQTPK